MEVDAQSNSWIRSAICELACLMLSPLPEECTASPAHSYTLLKHDSRHLSNRLKTVGADPYTSHHYVKLVTACQAEA